MFIVVVLRSYQVFEGFIVCYDSAVYMIKHSFDFNNNLEWSVVSSILPSAHIIQQDLRFTHILYSEMIYC